MIDWSKFANFTEAEFVCKCGCGRADMKESFMGRLQRIRDVYRRPMTITSGYRCSDYNARISNTGRAGPHTTGRAVDIAVSGENAFRLLTAAMSRDVRGIGLKQHGLHGKRFIHLDDLEGSLRPRVWTYSK